MFLLTLFPFQLSGWSYVRIIHFDCRYLASQAYNLYRFGADARRNIGFHPMIKSLFHRIVLDPLYYLRQGFPRANLCVPACMILAFHCRLGHSVNRTLNIHKMETELEALSYRSLLTPGTVGISLSQLSQLETLNSNPIHSSLLRLFPALAFYKGVAINQFRVRRSGTDFRIFPVSLSKHSRASDWFQIDLLIDSTDIRPESCEKSFDHSPTKHCLVITNLARLVAKMTGKCANFSKYEVICRTCFRLFRNTVGDHGRLKHDVTCTNQARGVLGRRKSRNILIHRPYVYNSFTNKKERNGLWFKKGFNYRRLRPLALGWMDFESYHVALTERSVNTNAFVKQPPSALAIQTPMSYAIAYTSLYPHIAIPPELSDVRIKFLDESNATLKDFYISLLLTIRKDLFLLSNFLRDVLSRDRPPPNMRERTFQQRLHIMSVSHCQICGSRYIYIYDLTFLN